MQGADSDGAEFSILQISLEEKVVRSVAFRFSPTLESEVDIMFLN